MQVKLRLAENQVSKANAKKDEIKARLTALKKSSTSKQKELEGEIERVSAQTASLKTELASERKKVSGLENELEVTKKEIVHTNKGSVACSLAGIYSRHYLLWRASIFTLTLNPDES